MRIYNYLFYRVAGYYLNRWEDVRGPIYGITLVTLMQLFHLWITLIIVSLFSYQVNYYLFEKWESKTFLYSWVLYPCLVAYSINMLKYLKFTKYEYYKEKWIDESKVLRKKRGWLIVLFILLTFLITILLAIYRKSQI